MQNYDYDLGEFDELVMKKVSANAGYGKGDGYWEPDGYGEADSGYGKGDSGYGGKGFGKGKSDKGEELSLV